MLYMNLWEERQKKKGGDEWLVTLLRNWDFKIEKYTNPGQNQEGNWVIRLLGNWGFKLVNYLLPNFLITKLPFKLK